jgi:hypothetical protein
MLFVIYIMLPITFGSKGDEGSERDRIEKCRNQQNIAVGAISIQAMCYGSTSQ